MDFVLMPNIDSLQILFFILQLNLFVTELFTKTLLLFIQVQEHLNIAIQLRFLFIFNNLLDFSLLDDILPLLILDHVGFLVHLLFDFCLQFSELLGLLTDVFMHSKLHLIQVLLVYFSCFP